MQQNWSLKKVLASSALALLLTSSAYAIPRGPCDPKAPDVCCEEPPPGPFAFSYPKDMDLTCPRDFYFRADLLVMQPKEDGLEFAVTDNTVGGNELTGGIVQGFSTGQHDWDWDVGFRLGVGFYLNHDAWNIDLQWTWFQVNNDRSATATANGVLVPQWIPPTGAPAAGDAHASARWEMSMNIFDISIGKPYHVSRHLVVLPFFGLRGAWIDQDFTARYGGNFSTKMFAKNDFWGVGTRIGFNSEWNLGGGWQLLANTNASLLYGKFDVDQDQSLAVGDWTLRHEFYRDSTNWELQIGLAWGTHFNKQQHYVKLQAMWEFHQWWDQNWLRKIYLNNPQGIWVNDTISRGDLSLSGVSFRITFDF